jgi:hypothetical protein
MKVGDLVKRHSSQRIGIVLQKNDGCLKVHWNHEYGTFWAPERAVEVVSEMPNNPLTQLARRAIL